MRIDAARVMFNLFRNQLLCGSEIKINNKVQFYKALILLYNCETWPVRDMDLQKLEVFYHFCLRRIARVCS